MSVVTWHSHNTKLTACSVECCHHPGLGNLVAVGSYQLIQDTGAREGQVQLGVVSRDTNGDHVSYESNHILDTGSGVLDMKWSHHDKPLLATAQSDGRVCLYEVTLGVSDTCILKLMKLMDCVWLWSGVMTMRGLLSRTVLVT